MNVGLRNCSCYSFGSEKAINLGGGHEDSVVSGCTQHQLHVCARQVEVTRCQVDDRVSTSLYEQLFGYLFIQTAYEA